MDEKKGKLRKNLFLDFENRRVIYLCNIPGFHGQVQEYITFEAIQDLNKQIEEGIGKREDGGLRDKYFPTNADVINYVKSMNTHILIWINAAWNQAELLRRYIGEKKVVKSPGLSSGFNFIKCNVKAVVGLIDRMEEGLNIRREDNEL